MTRRPSRLAVAFSLFVLLVAAGCSGGSSGDDDATAPAEAGAPSGERPVQFEGAGKVKLFGTFAMPETRAGQTVPGVLVLPTGGAGDRNGPRGRTGVSDPFTQDLSDAFTRAGLATYRYDQRGTGSSKIEPDVRLRFDDLVADGRAALDLLSQRRETAGRELAVVGYDQGGLVALRLAAVDDRVRRVILISTPGRSLVDVRAAQLSERFGPDSIAALRALVADLLATRALPPLDTMRTELRTLFPPEEAAYLADLYSIDPAAEAAKVRAQALVVVPADPAPYDPQRLAAALRGAPVVTSAGSGTTLLISGAEKPDDRTDPMSPAHEHGAGPPINPMERDAATLDRVAQFISAPARPS